MGLQEGTVDSNPPNNNAHLLLYVPPRRDCQVSRRKEESEHADKGGHLEQIQEQTRRGEERRTKRG
jgi:hypothetical protein